MDPREKDSSEQLQEDIDALYSLDDDDEEEEPEDDDDPGEE